MNTRWYVVDDFRKRWYGPYPKEQADRIRKRLKIVSDAGLQKGETNVTLASVKTVHGPGWDGPDSYFGATMKKGDARLAGRKKE